MLVRLVKPQESRLIVQWNAEEGAVNSHEGGYRCQLAEFVYCINISMITETPSPPPLLQEAPLLDHTQHNILLKRGEKTSFSNTRSRLIQQIEMELVSGYYHKLERGRLHHPKHHGGSYH